MRDPGDESPTADRIFMLFWGDLRISEGVRITTRNAVYTLHKLGGRAYRLDAIETPETSRVQVVDISNPSIRVGGHLFWKQDSAPFNFATQVIQSIEVLK